MATCAVAALVGVGDAQLAFEAMNSGAHDCLEKGRAGGMELRRAVSQAIEKAEQDRLRALRSGFQMHVIKPVEPAELAAVITSLIRRPMAPRRLIPAEKAWRHRDREPHQMLEQERKDVTADRR